MKTLFVLLFASLYCVILLAQTNQTEIISYSTQYLTHNTSKSLIDSMQISWVSRYNGPAGAGDAGIAIICDDNQNVYVTGYSGYSSRDYVTVKYNREGEEQWLANYDGTGNSIDDASAIAIDNVGNVYVTGISLGSGSTSFDYATIKYNNEGVQQWVSRYNGTGDHIDAAYAIAVDNSGNVYVTGYSTGTGEDFLTIKYNSEGVEQWAERYNGPGNSDDGAYSITIDNSGNIYVTGYSTGSGTGKDYLTIKYNSEGVEQWVARYDGTGNSDDISYDVGIDISGNIYVTGYSTGSGTGKDFVTIKYNPNGVEQWVARYNGPGNNWDQALDLDIDNSGNVIVTGHSIGQGGTYRDYATIKYNPEGDMLWVNRYNSSHGSTDSFGYALDIDNSGNVYVTGYTYVLSADYATVKYSNDGVEQWAAIYNGTGNYVDYGYALAVDNLGNAYVTGLSFGAGTSADCVTIKYSQLTTFQLTVNVNNGWNMVSAPGLHPTDQNVATWWTHKTGTVWGFNGSQYVTRTVTTPGEGYWMKNTLAETYNYPAITIVPHNPIPATLGWNMLGGYETSPTITALKAANPQITGTVWGFNGSQYVSATNLVPGYSYWVKTTAAGNITIPNVLAKGNEEVTLFKEDWGRIILTDAAGLSYTLYAVKGEVDLSQYEMPPMPPAGSFDIRFSSGRIAEDLNSSMQTIDMVGITYPLTVRVEGMDIRLMDETGKNVNVNLKSGEDVVISDATIQKLMVSGESIPTVYALEQNYPNPFNPSTVIEFLLPENVGNVKLSIYNALGEKVAELVNTALVAGKYSYQWNAQNVATGMYIYELRTDNFLSVKKMMLLK